METGKEGKGEAMQGNAGGCFVLLSLLRCHHCLPQAASTERDMPGAVPAFAQKEHDVSID